MNDISIDDLPESQPYQFPKPLAELYPDEIRFFASRFIWSSNRSGFYTRTGYEKEKGWHARKRLGVEWMPLYPALVAELIEKHLDFDRFCLNADWMSPNRPKDDETAFWLGTMAGKYTYYDCIATTCDWMAVCAGLLEPIVKEMHRQMILQSRVIQTDDTPVTVLDKVKGRYQGRLWIHLGDRDHPHVVFDFTTDRSGAGPERMLKGYQGYLQADAYSAYDRLYADGTIVEVGCWMHARRKFFEAKTSDPLRAHQALAWIRGLYAVEKEAKTKELDDAQRLTLRQEQSRPILETIKEWLDKEVGQVLPKSPMAEAIGYALNHWKALERYLEVGFLEIDNGASERGLRPVAVGRNNWLFVGSEAGGKTAAILMSLCATCKRVGIDPLAYLRDVLERISTHPASRIAELVPDQWRKIRAGPDQGESPSTGAGP